MSEPAAPLSARPSLEQLRKQAKELLRQYRSGDVLAQKRLAAFEHHDRSVSLADAQFTLAREHGFSTWSKLKQHVGEVVPSRMQFYKQLAVDLLQVVEAADDGALRRLRDLVGGNFTAEQAREQVLKRLGGEAPVSLAGARLFVAKLYGFGTWDEFEQSIAEPPLRIEAKGGQTPPFYRIDRENGILEVRPPLSAHDWDEIFEVVRDNRIPGLRASGQMTDSLLQRLARLDVPVTSLFLEGSRRVTDAGLAHLAGMSGIERLSLSGCGITDAGLGVLRHLRALREFQMHHHTVISDAGLANLRWCDGLERVELLGSSTGDGVIRALAGKPVLRHFRSGNLVTDAGLQLLHEWPAFKTWQGGATRIGLMEFDAEPNYLLLRGEITDSGMAVLGRLDGLFALNLDDARLGITATGLQELRALPNLNWLGFDAKDDTMSAIAALPHLRMLMCQDTQSTDKGFQALSRSRTIEYIWGRRCYGLTGPGFAALADMPSLRGLAVSCKNVDDSALSLLPRFAGLKELMPMDFLDAGFRHVGQCKQLEAVWCMYCRETGDASTEYLTGLSRLKTYYAGANRITDRSLEILSGMHSLERLTFYGCSGVTNDGVALLATLPRLQALTLESMPGVSRTVVPKFPSHVQVRIEV